MKLSTAENHSTAFPVRNPTASGLSSANIDLDSLKDRLTASQKLILIDKRVELGWTSTNSPSVPIISKSAYEKVLEVSSLPETGRDRIEILQEWEGYVKEVGDETFTVELVDLTDYHPNETEETGLPKSDLTTDDLKLLRPGAIFRWLIGYFFLPHGTKLRVSSIVFRRLPVWTEDEIKQAKEEAKRIASSIQWD